MNQTTLIAIALMLGAVVSPTLPAAANGDKLVVLKEGPIVSIRSHFSKKEDLVVTMKRGRNEQIDFFRTLLIPREAEMPAAGTGQGTLIHRTSDGCAPWQINGTYIGANHGCSSVFEISSKAHGKTVSDIGSEWTDARGKRFYLIMIVDDDKLWFLSRNKAKPPFWNFESAIEGDSLAGSEGTPALKIDATTLTQLVPSTRVARQDYLTDGTTPLPDGIPVTCDWFQIVEENDIVNPASALERVIDHPGTEPLFVSSELPAVISNRISYRYYPNGANIVETHSTALQDFNIGYMGFVQAGKLEQGKFDAHEYYIPKTLPFKRGENGYDFRAIEDFRKPIPVPLYFGAEEGNVEDPSNLPDRFVQFLGIEENGAPKRKVGFVIGLSLVEGVSSLAQRSRHTRSAGFIHRSFKTYPKALDDKLPNPIRAGTEFRCVAYRQYFHVSSETKATCFFWHQEGDRYLVYADYHQPVKNDRLRLPDFMTGKTVTPVEKSGSVELVSGQAVPAEGLEISVNGHYGSLVVEVK